MQEVVIPLRIPGPPALQIASDLHLEHYSKLSEIDQNTKFSQIIVPSAPVLALLGDIGIPTHPIYRRFLLRQAEEFEAVLILAGNHEFYDVRPPGPSIKPPEYPTWSEWLKAQALMKSSVQDMKSAIYAICAENPRLHFLDNTCVRFGNQPEDAALLCTTLWSHIPEAAMFEVQDTMNDYALIYNRIQEGDDSGGIIAKDMQNSPICQLTPSHTTQWHSDAVSWLRSEIPRLQSSGCSCIGVLSHHAPSLLGTSDPKHEGQVLGHAFGTDMDELYQFSAVRLWAYGHTHYNNDRDVEGCRLVSNQLGYQGETTHYRPDFVIDMQSLPESHTPLEVCSARAALIRIVSRLECLAQKLSPGALPRLQEAGTNPFADLSRYVRVVERLEACVAQRNG
eukprot:TRINITY_DN76490_c0_g1_i1.p1 TRINITY_DN76490_c0_g1~~TRINITY_DN76490_c0_g1_i1.p1  ORF type:complete len:407 (-),score=19.75 TRINITY_DN76490_c0_g1_i1:199-1380(-)